MLAGRLRPGSAADLTMAVLFLAATVVVATLIVHELTAIRAPGPPLPDKDAPAVAPAALPSLSIAVSVLPLPDGQELRVGDSIDKVTQVLQKAVETAEPAVQDGRIGRRITRHYRYGTLGFTVVFEPFEQKGQLRVAAIYIQ